MASLIIAAAALVALISSKVSTTLEQLAVASSSDRFQRLMDNAGIMANVDERELDTLREYVPSDYTLYLIDKQGNQISRRDPLTPDEVRAIRTMRNGDSASMISPHVFRFAQLKDGSILVMGIPWTPYASIPRQIAFYTALVALFTIVAFAIAAYYLSRDVTTPLNELQDVAQEVREYRDRVEYDPQRLDDIEDRLDLLNRLKRKYGATVEEVLAYLAQVARDIDTVEHAGERMEALRAERGRLASQYEALAASLTGRRKEAALRVAPDLARAASPARPGGGGA